MRCLSGTTPAPLARSAPAGKLLAALFQSVTLRTAGFASFNQDALTEASKLLSNILMFVGGSSGSTAGGVKTVTMGLVVLSAVSTMRGGRQVTVFAARFPSRISRTPFRLRCWSWGCITVRRCGAYRVRPVQFPERHL